MKYSDLPKNPIETTILILGCKWRILIVRELLKGTHRFCELKRGVGGITQKVLTSKLREMETLGIIERKVCDDKLQKVEYTLTDVGYSIKPILDTFYSWGKDYKRYIKLVEKRFKM